MLIIYTTPPPPSCHTLQIENCFNLIPVLLFWAYCSYMPLGNYIGIRLPEHHKTVRLLSDPLRVFLVKVLPVLTLSCFSFFGCFLLYNSKNK